MNKFICVVVEKLCFLFECLGKQKRASAASVFVPDMTQELLLAIFCNGT